MKNYSDVRADHWLSDILSQHCFVWGPSEGRFPIQEWTRLTLGLPDWLLTAYLPDSSSSEDTIAHLPGKPQLCDVRVTFRFKAEDATVIQAPRRDADSEGWPSIRPMRVADAQEVADIGRRAFSHSRFHRDPGLTALQASEIKAAWSHNLAAGSRAEVAWVAEASGVITGFVGVVRGANQATGEPHLIVDLVAVAPEFSGRGIGAALLGEAKSYARANNLDLVASTQNVNVSAMRLYERGGFCASPTRVEIYHCRPSR